MTHPLPCLERLILVSLSVVVCSFLAWFAWKDIGRGPR